MKRLPFFITFQFFSIVFLSLSGVSADRVTVFVSIVPQKYFVQQIGRDHVDVKVMVAPGASPATYEPKPRQMAALAKARIYFAIGVPFERAWLEKIVAANPEMTVVHTDKGIAKISMAAHRHSDEAADHDHQHAEDSHEHHQKETAGGSGRDPHIWLSPPLVKQQAAVVLRALKEIDPARQHDYQANYENFIAEIDTLDARLRKRFADKQGTRFMVFHPSWGYFARTYGLEQIAIEIEGKNPKPAQLQALIEQARRSEVKVIFVQPQFSTKSAELVAAQIGGEVAFADPLAEDWPANLQKVALAFEAALK